MHRIGARAEVRVTNQLIKEFKRVTGKENLLFRLAEATVDAGDQLVRDTVFPGRTTGGARGSGGGVQVVRADVSANGEGHAQGLLHQPLPGRADQVAVGAGIRQQQHHPSAAYTIRTTRRLRRASSA